MNSGTTPAAPSRSPVVAVTRTPVAAASFRGHVERLPNRPHVVDVARTVARVGRRREQLAAPPVMDPPVAAGEDVAVRIGRRGPRHVPTPKGIRRFHQPGPADLHALNPTPQSSDLLLWVTCGKLWVFLSISSGRLTKIVRRAYWGKSALRGLHVGRDTATISRGDEARDPSPKKLARGLAFRVRGSPELQECNSGGES